MATNTRDTSKSKQIIEAKCSIEYDTQNMLIIYSLFAQIILFVQREYTNVNLPVKISMSVNWVIAILIMLQIQALP